MFMIHAARAASPYCEAARKHVRWGRTLAVVSALAVVATAFVPSGGVASASSQPSTATPVPFLTLPFQPTPRMSVLSGWYYNGGGFHGGIDFINGSYSGGGWQTFQVIAAADGEACGNCSSRQGNAVWVKHSVNGATYYTYYGHLASISGDIPIGSQSNTVHVKRGQVLGMAGDTGAAGALHLHFGLYDSSSRPIDPYGIGKLRDSYPAPTSQPTIGWFTGNSQQEVVPAQSATNKGSANMIIWGYYKPGPLVE